MATRIDTPTAVPDLFGPGKNGFTEGPPATEFSPAWCNNAQEEICRVVEAAGLVVDPLNLGQMAEAIGSFPLVDPTLTGTLTVENGATIDVLAGGTIMADPGSSVDLSGTVIIGGTGSFTCNADASFAGDVDLGDSLGDDINVNGTVQGNIVGTAAGIVGFGYYSFFTPGLAPGPRQLSTDAFDQLVWNDDIQLNLVHYSPNGWVYATGDQEASTGLAAAHTVAQTSVAVTAKALGNVRVIVEGQVQVNNLGSTVTVAVQENQAGFADIGSSQVFTALKDTSDVADWQPFRHERIFNAGTATATLYRLSTTSQGGNSHQLKEVRLRVVNERA